MHVFGIALCGPSPWTANLSLASVPAEKPTDDMMEPIQLVCSAVPSNSF